MLAPTVAPWIAFFSRGFSNTTVSPKAMLAFKLDPKLLDGLPEPRPFREIFVYGVEVEGVHLRFGKVARGGLRWSDRAQDYRTEVLGLVKAQQVKNSVIVPVGAKGGFFPKNLPTGGSREAVFAAGTEAYKTYIRTLLSITDNIVDDAIVPPADTVRLDGDDPYFVVAADKGTATFSDTANGLAQEAGFWLDDAFASGGSAGYDHKKMAITARGAWETVKRHFREVDIDIQTTPFTVAGSVRFDDTLESEALEPSICARTSPRSSADVVALFCCAVGMLADTSEDDSATSQNLTSETSAFSSGSPW